jgi:hypothetical protein
MDTIEKLVDLLETQEPECVVAVNTAHTYEDDEGQDVEYACDVTLYWGNREYQMCVTAPLCRIGIPEEGKVYDISTLYWGGTSADWDYYINVAGLSEDEEIALHDMMDDKMAWYDPKQSGYTITIEHY